MTSVELVGKTAERVGLSIVEDHRFLGELVANELSRLDVEVTLLDPAVNTIHDVCAVGSQLVLLDVDTGPGLDSLELCRVLCENGVTVVLFTGSTDEILLARYLEHGAFGIVAKTEDLAQLSSDVTAAMNGRPIGPDRQTRHRLALGLRVHRDERERALEPFRALSECEAQVLRMVIGGRSVGAIATERYVSVTTVRAQVRSILSKLGVSSQLAAAALANQVGWPPDD